MDDLLKANRDHWDKLTPLHGDSEFYDVEGFRQGRCVLTAIDVEEVGDVSGKSLLHLQCHFGLDTLSWARRGATVTGVDFSEKAIALAQALAEELSLPARFICSEVAKLTESLREQFDIIYTSGGVLGWLPELRSWATAITACLKPTGFFYLREFHPTAYTYDDRKGVTEPTPHFPYFSLQEPLRFEDEWSYAGPHLGEKSVNFEWPHPLSEIINSLLEAGLRLEYLHEFPYCTFQSHPFLVQGDDGFWRYPEKPNSLPLMFSIKAAK
ncbi:MAG: methyltransferase domain-containing protein [bacterium]